MKKDEGGIGWISQSQYNQTPSEYAPQKNRTMLLDFLLDDLLCYLCTTYTIAELLYIQWSTKEPIG